MSKIAALLMEKMLSEQGENSLYTARVVKEYSKGRWTKRKLELALEMLAPNLKELAIFFELDPSKVDELAQKSGVELSKLSFLCMILNPREYFPMNDKTLSLSMDLGIPTDNYSLFLKEWRKILHAHSQYVDDFLEMYLLLFGRNNESMSNGSIVKEMIKLFEKKNFLSLNESDVRDFHEVYSSLLPSDQRAIANALSDSYVKGVLLRRDKRMLVVDGSNIALVNTINPNLDNIFLAFDLIGRMKKVPWPFAIIFDANFLYKLKGSQKLLFEKSFQKHRNVYFHSPADERVLEIASRRSAYILTNDRYLDYPKVDAIKLRFDGKKVWEDRR